MGNWRVLLMSVDECSSAVNTSHATEEPLMHATKAIRLSTNSNIRAHSRDWRAYPSRAILMPANDANGPSNIPQSGNDRRQRGRRFDSPFANTPCRPLVEVMVIRFDLRPARHQCTQVSESPTQRPTVTIESDRVRALIFVNLYRAVDPESP